MQSPLWIRRLWNLRHPTNFFRFVVGRIVSRSMRWRGVVVDDGKITLLTVDYHVTEHVLRLAASFRRHVEPLGDIVVVQNGPLRNKRELRRRGIRVAGFGLNIGHGPALDWGMRKVTTQYVLVCDPDTFVLSDQFRNELISRLEAYGVAGVLVSDEPHLRYYHPICTAFTTRTWKDSTWSFRDDLGSPEIPNDVGYQLTRHLGAIEPAAIIPLSRAGYAGAVFAECFTNTWAMAHIRHLAGTVYGRPIDDFKRWQHDWAAWVDRVAAGDDDVDGFPTWWPDTGGAS